MLNNYMRESYIGSENIALIRNIGHMKVQGWGVMEVKENTAGYIHEKKHREAVSGRKNK